MNKIILIICGISIALSVVLAATVAGMRNTLADREHELDAAHTEIETLRAERARIAQAIERLNVAVDAMTKGERDARERHEQRMEAVQNMETPETRDWLCEPVPDDICVLFGAESR